MIRSYATWISRTRCTRRAAGNVPKVNLLLKYGADVNATSYNGETSFSYACANNHLKVAKALHAHGADINKVVGKGECAGTPLDWAMKCASGEFV